MAMACRALGINRSTVYAWRKRRDAPSTEATTSRRHCPQPRALSAEERAQMLEIAHSEPYRDQPVYEIYHDLLQQGVYLGSLSTWYRQSAWRCPGWPSVRPRRAVTAVLSVRPNTMPCHVLRQGPPMRPGHGTSANFPRGDAASTSISTWCWISTAASSWPGWSPTRRMPPWLGSSSRRRWIATASRMAR